jgi:hypothetical protein
LADTKLTALTADATPSSDDLIYTVNDPGGTPASRKVTIANLNAALDHGTLAGRTDDDHTQYLLINGTRAMTGAITLSAPLTVANGGTGAATFTDAGVLIGNGAGAIAVTTAGTSGQVLTSNGAGVDPTFQNAAAGSGDVVGPASSTDNALARFDSTTGKLLQDGLVTSSDLGAVAGVTQLDVDNLRLDANTLSTTNANGDLTLAPNGTGSVTIPLGTKGSPGLEFAGDTGTGFFQRADNAIMVGLNGVEQIQFSSSSAGAAIFNGGIGLANGSPESVGSDAGIARAATAETTRITNGGSGIGFLATKRVTEAHTSGDTLNVVESYSLHTNEGAAGAVALTLPAAAVGLEYHFYVQAAQNVAVTAGAGDTIRVAAGVSSAGGTATNGTVGGYLALVAINATEWVAMGTPTGTWTLA